jgi:hypothetical protein
LAGERVSRLKPDLGRLADPDFLGSIAAPAAAAVLTLIFVLPTVAPTVGNWDTAEFQTVGPVLGTAHPTGFPSYTVLGWLASIVLQPFGEPAFRMNLLQALLAAVAVAAATAIVQVLTGRRMIALATGLLLATSQLFWRLSTHADPHMFHVALTALLFLVLLTWDHRRHSADPETVAHADRWLVAAAGIYGVAVANHGLALLLPPAIGLFVLAADWRIIFRWRTIATCAAVLAGTIAVFFLELPIRAAMHAPLVYGHPDTLGGFLYVILAQQFEGSLSHPFDDLPTKAGHVLDLITGWLGPMAILAAVGLVTSLIRRPRYVLLTGLAAVVTCGFAASYSNASIERYYLLPLLIAFTWIGLGFADIVAAFAWSAAAWQRPAPVPEAGPLPEEEQSAGEPAIPTPPRERGSDQGWSAWALLVGEMVVAVAIAFPTVSVVAARQGVNSLDNPAGVSEAANTQYSTWMKAVLAPPEQGGLAKDAVIESTWSASTTLWYGQRVLGLRPDVVIVDDSTRKNDHIGRSGEVWDVFDMYLGTRPVYTDRFQGGCDGIDALSTAFDLRRTSLTNIYQVVGRLDPRVDLRPCDPVKG